MKAARFGQLFYIQKIEGFTISETLNYIISANLLNLRYLRSNLLYE